MLTLSTLPIQPAAHIAREIDKMPARRFLRWPPGLRVRKNPSSRCRGASELTKDEYRVYEAKQKLVMGSMKKAPEDVVAGDESENIRVHS
ncbi:hypothetical protein SCP_0102110 [Sparassis crispa]|uniref:Uncharacterized protein n=1 Tax=Sparassis crispa TaxID=139825 RepID=A0A401G598_9APHY|nr:hypothetical protein SCP_0102110 [Sparassis crispa]GBE77338.1 hypothetical protein SCP_0102110 [Sparassis crispa]